MYTGAEKYLVVSEETTFGLAGTTRAYARVTQYGVNSKPEVKRQDEHLGQPDHTLHVRNKLAVGGQISGKAYGIGAVPVIASGAVPLEQWWSWAYTRTSGQLKSLTGEWSAGDDPLQHLGMRIDQFNLQAAADGGEVTFDVTVKAQDEIKLGSALAVPSPDPYANTAGRRAGPMMYQTGASLFLIDAVGKSFTSWKLSVANKLAEAWLGKKSAATGMPDCQILDQTRPTRREISGEIKVLVTDTFYSDKVRSDTRFDLTIAAQGYKDATFDRKALFRLRGTVPQDFVFDENLDAFGFLTIPFIAEKVGTNEIVEATFSDT